MHVGTHTTVKSQQQLHCCNIRNLILKLDLSVLPKGKNYDLVDWKSE